MSMEKSNSIDLLERRISKEAAARRSLETRGSKEHARNSMSRGSKDLPSSRQSSEVLSVQEIQRLSAKLIEQCTEAKHNKEEIGEFNRFLKTIPFDLMEARIP
jgi:hypothetical protein